MTASVPAETDFQRLVVEQALALAREVESAAGTAPPGRVLDCCEGFSSRAAKSSSPPSSSRWPSTPPPRR